MLDAVTARIDAEGKKSKSSGSVLFAVMEMDSGESPVYKALKSLHANSNIFSYGISDNPGGIFLYRPSRRRACWSPASRSTRFCRRRSIRCRTWAASATRSTTSSSSAASDGTNPVVFCGSSNLASGGEEENGDNLLAIHDADVVTAFAIEALGLVDHFDFLDRSATGAAAGTDRHAAGGESRSRGAGGLVSVDH